MDDAQRCTVEFPPHVNVSAPRERLSKIQTKGGERLGTQGDPTILEGVPMAKALKHAFQSGAKVTDADGNVIASPRVKVTDMRAPAAADQVAKLTEEKAALEARVDRLEAALETKADRPGPKAGTKTR